MKKYGYPGAPLILGIVLGPMAEQNLNRALQISKNDWTILFSRPISLAFLLLAAVFILMQIRSTYRQSKAKSQVAV